jgi:hypothetical protein
MACGNTATYGRDPANNASILLLWCVPWRARLDVKKPLTEWLGAGLLPFPWLAGLAVAKDWSMQRLPARPALSSDGMA